MSELRFDNRVAVITGAGRGLGRSYALLLASRGAKIVVNDPGVSMQGDEANTGPAQQVVEEIIAAGGEAIANTDSVATPEGGQAIIDSAINHFGRVDILIHNAGIVRRAPLDEMSYEDFETVLDVHLRGGFHVLRAAFPLMKKAGYGRVVMTSSIAGLYGSPNTTNYSVSKTGLVGLTNIAAIEGAEFDIKCNVILPAAVTRMSEGIDTSTFPPMDPDLVAPAVGWLCHESCSISGEMLSSGAGRVAKVFITETPGVYRSNWTLEDIAEQIDAIRNTDQTVTFPVVPSGQLGHLQYSFALANKN